MGKKGQGVDHRSPRLRQALEYVFTEGEVGEGGLGEGRASDSRARPAALVSRPRIISSKRSRSDGTAKQTFSAASATALCFAKFSSNFWTNLCGRE